MRWADTRPRSDFRRRSCAATASCEAHSSAPALRFFSAHGYALSRLRQAQPSPPRRSLEPSRRLLRDHIASTCGGSSSRRSRCRRPGSEPLLPCSVHRRGARRRRRCLCRTFFYEYHASKGIFSGASTTRHNTCPWVHGSQQHFRAALDLARNGASADRVRLRDSSTASTCLATCSRRRVGWASTAI